MLSTPYVLLAAIVTVYLFSLQSLPPLGASVAIGVPTAALGVALWLLILTDSPSRPDPDPGLGDGWN
jgi:hypothetical protein